MSDDKVKRLCELSGCNKEGRYRIQTSPDPTDIHWFCQLHARTFDLSVVNQGPFIGAAGPNWTDNGSNEEMSDDNGFEKPAPGIVQKIRMRYVSTHASYNYTREDLKNLNILGLQTGASAQEIKKAYKKLVKYCHPDQNPELENGRYIFNKVTKAYNALKDKDFN